MRLLRTDEHWNPDDPLFDPEDDRAGHRPTGFTVYPDLQTYEEEARDEE